MAEGTRLHQYTEGRFTEIEGRIQKFEDAFVNFKLEMADQLADQMAKIQDLFTTGPTKVDLDGTNGSGKGILGSAPIGTAPIGSAGDTRVPGQSSFSTKVNPETHLRPPKLSFPKFDGNDPKTWLRKCDRFFLIHPVPPDQKVPVASIHLRRKQRLGFSLTMT